MTGRDGKETKAVAFLLALLAGMTILPGQGAGRALPPLRALEEAPRSARIGTGLLASVEGIGPWRAERLALAARARGLRLGHPLLLPNIDGIGPITRQRLLDSWASLRPAVHWRALP